MKDTIRPLSWHRECLKNSRATLTEREAQLDRIAGDVERMRIEIAFYANQIVKAEKDGREGFDRDRFGVRRKQFRIGAQQ